MIPDLLYLLINVAIAVGTILAGLVAFRVALRHRVDQIWTDATSAQESAITALQAEMETLKDEVKRLSDENAKLREQYATMKKALRAKGWHMTVDGEIVYVPDLPASSSPQRIQGA